MKRLHGWDGGGGRMLHAMQPYWKFILPNYIFKKSEWSFSKKPAKILMTQHFSNLNMEYFFFSP